jgi:tetratricopeptide (TPR) repeat protein
VGQFAAAEGDFQTALALLSQTPDDVTLYGLYVNRSSLDLRRHRYDRAADDSRKAIQLKPDHWQGYVHLAQALEGRGKVKEAVRQFDNAVALAPRLAALYRARARLHRKNHEPAAALNDLDQAISREVPGRASRLLAEDHVERGRILETVGQPEAAVRAYAGALALEPNQATALRLQAKVLLDLHRYEEAARALDQYVRTGQPSAEVFRARGLVRARQNHFAGAVEDFTRALELEPDHAETLAYRGWAHLMIASPRRALADFEEALGLDPDNAEGYAGRGNARVQLGQVHAAVADADQALRRGPRKPRLLYNAARIYAQALGQLEGRSPNRDPPGPNLRSRYDYQERAVRVLREALALAGRERAELWHDITTDPAFVWIHRSSGYLQLAREQAPPPGERGTGKLQGISDRHP